MKKIITLMFMLMMTFSASSFARFDSMGCFTPDKNDAALNEKTGMNVGEARQGFFDQIKNPAQELVGCAMSVLSPSGPGDAMSLVKSNCACSNVIKDLCRYSVRKGKISYKLQGGADLGMCLVFPFQMWTKQ